MCLISFPAPSLFHEKRLIFVKERQDIPVPYRYEEFENSLELRRAERDVFRRAYRESIESLPGEPAIAPDVLCALSDNEANRVFEALESEGTNAEDVLLLRTRRSSEQGLKRCKQQVYEQLLLVNALKDVSAAQTLLYDYMWEQTARENLDDNPQLRKRNKTEAFALLGIISEIGNGNCLFPSKEKKTEKAVFETEKEKERTEEKKRELSQKRKDFRYYSIRECEKLDDEKGNLVLPMPLMRSLAFLHLRFNDLDVDSAMDAQSIALAEHSGEDLLTLARSELDPAKCKPLLTLSRELRRRKEPIAEDFQQYSAMIEKLPALPRLILTLLYKDIVAAHPREAEDKFYGREDLVEQYSKGGNIVTDTERAVLIRELIEYLADYMEALTETGEAGEGSDGFMVRNAFQVYKLLRENARKYLFQSGVNYICLTGSDHGVKHLIQGNVRFTTQVAEKLRWSARDRVCLRQTAVDHDLGYTHTGLQLFSMHEEGIPLDNGYYGLVKDHPLYSSAYFEAHRPEYEEYFGKQGTRIMGLSILDHSEVKGHLRDADPAKRAQALFCRIDCLAVSADLKAAPAFMHPKVLVAMSKAMEASEHLKVIDARMENLWKADEVKSDEYKWLAAVQESLRTIAGHVKQYLLGLDKEIYEDEPVLQQAYHRAVDQHYDPFNPMFPVQRDFGSNAIEFAGIDVGSTADRDYLTARLSIRPLLFSISDYFGGEQGASFATSAIKKLLDDFGGAIPDPAKLIQALYILSLTPKQWHTEKDVEENADGGVEYRQHHETHVNFEFEMLKRDPNSALIDQMIALLPSLRMMRKLMLPDFDKSRLKSTLIEIAQDTKNDRMKRCIKNKDLDGATEHFFAEHFTLPT